MNSASRIAAIVERAATQKNQGPARAAWALAFGIQESDGPERNIEIVRLIGALRNEADLAEAKITAHGKLKQERWKPAFDSLRKALTIDHLNGQWGQYLQHLPSTVIQMLWVCGDDLPQEEEPVPPEDLQKMMDLVGTTRADVLGSEMDATLKSYMLRQIETIERGLRDYQIQGARALGTAIREIAVQMVEEPAQARAAQKTVAAKGLESLTRMIVAAGPYVGLIGTLLGAGEKAVNLLQAPERHESTHVEILVQNNITVEQQLIIQRAQNKLLPPGPPEKKR